MVAWSLGGQGPGAPRAGAAEFSCSIVGSSQITLRTTGRTFTINAHPWHTIVSGKGRAYFSISGMKGVKANVHCFGGVSSRLLRDTHAEKSVRVRFPLSYPGRQDGKEVWTKTALELELIATIKEGVPALFVSSQVHNGGETDVLITNGVMWVFVGEFGNREWVCGGGKPEGVLPHRWGNLPRREWYHFPGEEDGRRGFGVIAGEHHLFAHSPNGIVHYKWDKWNRVNAEAIASGRSTREGEWALVPISDGGLSAMQDIVDVVKLKRGISTSPADAAIGEVSNGVYVASLLKQAPEMDGELTEWAGAPALELRRATDMHNLTTDPYDGPGDLSAKVRIAYDRANFYFAAQVRDSAFCQLSSGGGIYGGDSIQLAFDTLATRSTAYDQDDYEFGLALTPQGTQLFCWRAAAGNGAGLIKDAAAAVVRDEEHRMTRYELALPWERLAPFRLERGRMGFTFLVNDSDGYGRKQYMGWTGFAGIGQEKNPSLYGELRLEGLEETIFASKTFSCFLSAPDACEAGSAIEVTATCYAPAELTDVDLAWSVQDAQGAAATGKREKRSFPKGLHRIPLPVDTKGYEGRSYSVAVAFRSRGRAIASQSRQITVYSQDTIDTKLERARRLQDELGSLVDAAHRKKLALPYVEARLFLLKDFIDYTRGYVRRKSLYLWNNKSTVDLTRGSERLQRLRQATENADWLLAAGTAAIAQAKRLIADPGQVLPVPEYDLKRNNLTLRDGAIYCNSKPVLLMGTCAASHWFAPFQNRPGNAGALRPYGFNYNQSFDYIGRIESMIEGTGVNGRKLPLTLDAAREHNIALAYKLQPIFGRRVIPDAIPEPGSELGAKHRAAFGHAIPALKKGEYLFSVPLGNELRLAHFDDSAQRLLREYLQELYGTIEKLNASWGSAHGSFGDIVCSPRDKSTHITKWLDFQRFSQQRAEWYFRYLRSLAQAEYPDLWTSEMYMSSGIWRDLYDESQGYDMEGPAEIFELKDVDTASFYPSRADDLAFDVTWRLPVYDALRSMRPEKVIVDNEYHFIQDADTSRYPYEYCYAMAFQGFLHGMRACALWHWGRLESHTATLAGYYTRAECTDALSHCALDVRRLAPYIIEFSRARSDVALLWAPQNNIGTRHRAGIQEAYVGLLFLNQPIWFVTEKQIRARGLDQYKALIVPEATRVDREAYAEVLSFAHKGGKVVFVGGNCFTEDQFAHQRDTSELNSLPSVTAVSGQGPLHYAPQFARLYDDLGIRPLIRTVDSGGNFAWGIESQSVRANGEIVTYVINLNRRETPVNLIAANDRRITKARDLITARNIRFPYTAKPMEVLLVATNDRRTPTANARSQP